MEINENKLKEILNEQRREFQHFMGIMKEDGDSKMQLLGEQFQEIKSTLDHHSKILESHTDTLSSHTQMIGALMEDVHIIKSDIHFMKADLKKKVDYDEFE